MAKFFEYNSVHVARIYDKLRLPHGADVIVGILHVHGSKPLKDIHLLDAGCGTGIYAKSLIEMGVGKMTLLDGSPEMLHVAKEKLDNEFRNNTIDAFVEAKFPSFPFQDETFDAVMFNQDNHLLDSGCGTGIYAKSLNEMGVVKMTLLNDCPEMLHVAKEKLDNEFRNNTIDLDADMFKALNNWSQSLHHVDTLRDGQNYPNLERTLKDVQRILKTDGILIISTGLASTIRESVWFLQLQHGIKEKIANSVMPVSHYMSLFEKHGFHCVSGMNLLTNGGSNILDNFLEPEAVLNEEWRLASSMFGVASEQEIQELENNILEMKRKGDLTEFIKEHDHTSERGSSSIFAYVSRKHRDNKSVN